MDFPQWEEWKPSQSQNYSQGLSGLDDDNENNEHEAYHHEKDAILFLIDSHLPMFMDSLSSNAKFSHSTTNKSSHLKSEVKSEEVDNVAQTLSSIQKKEGDSDDEDNLKADTKKKGATNDGTPVKPFAFALKAAVQVACDKIISNPSDLLGMVFYGTKEKNNAFDFENINVYQPLDQPDANKIKDIETLARYEEAFPLGSCDDGAGDKADFSKALWTCQNLFSTVPSNVGFKRIFLFTTEEDPSQSNVDIRKQCMERASTLIESDIIIELFILRCKDNPLNAKVFWEHIVACDSEEYTGRITIETVEHFKDLKDVVRRKEFKKRSLATLPMNIGKMEMAVSVYNLVQRAKKNAPIMLDAKTNKPVKSETRILCEDTATELMPNEIKTFFNYGGESVFFSKEEMGNIRHIGSHGVHILGFKPKTSLKVYHNYRSSSFIYPNDFKIKNSSTAFSALIKKMIEKEKIAIARINLRQKSRVAYAALLPQEELLDEEGAQIEPPGLHIIYLPFADGIRQYDNFPVRKPDPTDEQITSAKKMIKKLTIDFSSQYFENPVVQKHYAALQALALEHTDVEDVKDVLQPDYDGMSKYQAYMDAFQQNVYQEGYDPFPKTKAPAAKRKRAVKAENPDDDDERPSKKRKTVKTEKKPQRPIDMVKEVREGTAKKLKVDILRSFLKKHGKQTMGKKAELLDRIEDFLRERGKI
uniref:SAP domain-containing protein n=1 Tax=Percolomonas cosmopolitus TaxID=63605 RepID=A0A7S1KSL9_9EUKA|mmetsp:Transcript_7403/g.27652  ORF Transcript_7403/g.27652 Transcript_7403/m.27652 type:complete len:701 (+) Transcript_7403:164-2266(+)|eukprot:CAMPEP_0117454934 /NCGR_PEP_ID=MMETSP0759-20121206/11077_1 /TAXON_ID=63605 /ORGANISM="Percolomonas cosmopolitus, Strain WS" /LENGTH=700 /DNA_ID=CAMNT_0005248177 /DNA_START=2976 /DNA_END=5078 /DNA_ORIENTATION=+